MFVVKMFIAVMWRHCNPCMSTIALEQVPQGIAVQNRKRRFGGRPGVIIGLDFMPAPAQGPTGPLLVAALAVPIVAALAKSGSSSVGIGTQLAPAEAPEGLEIATFAGGCFWGLELAFQRAIGVTKTMAGYTQGTVPNPSYEEVCTGRTGHTEAVQVYFDPTETTYKALLDVFYAHTDPTQLNQQGNDRGTQYRSGLYYHGDQQKAEALASLAEAQAALDAGMARIARGGNKVVVEVLPASDYYVAEGYHQQYLAKGGRFNRPQSAEKGNTDPIRCYG
eukprot:evm.model.scf_293.4 EVM.evm.TU.scf_293.4   scf_293:61793-64221(+)